MLSFIFFALLIQNKEKKKRLSFLCEKILSPPWVKHEYISEKTTVFLIKTNMMLVE